MDEYESLSHTAWECKYHVVFIPKCRRNWIFFGSDNGGRTAAVLKSFIASCQQSQVEPWASLNDVLARIAAHPVNALDELLPANWKPVSA